MRYALLALLMLAACGDSPAPPAGPSWCGEESRVLAGQWEGGFTRQGHDYAIDLALEEAGDCTFEWSYQTYLLEHEGQPRLLIYDSRGIIVIVETHAAGDIVSMAMESQRTYLYTLDREGNPSQDREAEIYDPSLVKVWGDYLVIWKSQYRRKQ